MQVLRKSELFISIFSMIYMAWVYCVENFTNPEILQTYFWPFNYVPIGTALVALATHLVMTYRIYFMTKRKAICAVLLVLALGTLGLGVTYGAVTFASPQRRTIKRIVAGWLGIQALLDLLIAGCLVFFLHRQRTKSTKANSVINRLIQGAMQTCILPTTFAVAGLIAFVSSPKTSVFTMFVIPIGRAYTITLMDGLNIRAELKDKLLAQEDGNDNTGLVWANPTKSARQPAATSICVDMLRSVHSVREPEAARSSFGLAPPSKSRNSEENLKGASFDQQSPPAVIVLRPDSPYRNPAAWD
ncbi:hypothetical protein CVT24_002777 [Panaeolus cyanescens]|uniref:DUF6534 domain-containing protein n=1 Tax=Panaeolus cyanescens TaxID=181874 RepID=A0A409VNF0_9AGAR|nr:hypothetical protein CVT24_002777 [Panaeolus cyanescens]